MYSLQRLRQMLVEHLQPRGQHLLLRHDLGRREQLLVGRGALLLGAIELEDRALAGRIGIVDEHVQQEAIELRLGQRIRAFLLDRVLRRHDHEQRRQRIRHGADRDLPLAHRLEQRRLHLRRRAVDLVGEHEVVEHRPLPKHERAVLRPIDLGAREIGGQQVRRELQAMEVAFDAVAQDLDRARLREPRRAFDEQVAVAKQRDEHAIQQSFLTDDETLQVRFELPELFL